MTILAIDQAKRTGWAVATPPYRCAPTPLEFQGGAKTPKHFHDEEYFESASRQYGRLFLNFGRWLERHCEAYDVHAIVYESPIKHHSGQAAQRIAVGMAAVIEMVAVKHRFALSETTNNVVKKHATGRGNAKKEQMIAAAEAVGWKPVGDNDADALWMLDHKIHVLKQ